MKDEFEHHSVALSAPLVAAEAITPSDTQDLAFATRAVYVGTSGTLSVTLVSGDSAVLANAQAGVIYPLRVARVKSTGTSAGQLIGLR